MDVVGYFAAHGHSARIKMFHCVRADLTGTDCPYELALVPKETIKGDYFTISASGVVQVRGEGCCWRSGVFWRSILLVWVSHYKHRVMRERFQTVLFIK